MTFITRLVSYGRVPLAPSNKLRNDDETVTEQKD